MAQEKQRRSTEFVALWWKGVKKMDLKYFVERNQ